MRDTSQTVRFLLQMGALAAVSYWGSTQASGFTAYLLSVGAPLLMLFFWGAFIAPQRKYPTPPWLASVLAFVVFGVAAFALVDAGERELAMGYFGAVVINALFMQTANARERMR